MLDDTHDMEAVGQDTGIGNEAFVAGKTKEPAGVEDEA